MLRAAVNADPQAVPVGYDRDEGEPSLTSRPSRWILLVLAAVFALLLVSAGSQQLLWFWLNVQEFGDLFVLPIYFELLGGLVLAGVALVRLDLHNRRSISWWLVRFIVRLVRERGVLEYVPPEYAEFHLFKLPRMQFVMWQLTKLLVGMLLFPNALFGMALTSWLAGWEPGVGELWRLLLLPFVTPPSDPRYAAQQVVPLAPVLTLLAAPVLAALGIRLLLLVGLTQLIKVVTAVGVSAQRRGVLATLEGLVALALAWSAVNTFFTSFIDYNTRWVITGFLVGTGLFTLFAILDSRYQRGLGLILRRRVFLRVGALVIVALLIGSILSINNSIADARKVEFLGPYTAQEIGVNRFLAQLDEVAVVPYNFSLAPLPAQQIDPYVRTNAPLLRKIRLWDAQAALDKVKPEIGLIPFVRVVDSDILRFNRTLYWSASLAPRLPPTVQQQDIWFNEHFVYTHVPNGFLLLDGHIGSVVDSGRFFTQRRIYYGEGGLLKQVWAAYPQGRTQVLEVDRFAYNGRGGIDLGPPLSWLFEFNFFLAFRDQTIHALRFRDVFDRMHLLYPYFEYAFFDATRRTFKPIDIFPVTDGARTYWLVPLIVRLDAGHLPWSRGNPFMRLVGYALVDIFDGSIQVILMGKDFFSDLFRRVYRDFTTTEIPPWLTEQLRYPEELFEYRVSMFNFYHVTDPATFIFANEFFEVPDVPIVTEQGVRNVQLDTYYIMAQPPGFTNPTYLGLLSLERRAALTKNLAGYVVVENDAERLGRITFYEVPPESQVKLLGPSSVLEALEKNPEFRTLRTLLKNPRVGDIILYRVGIHDVYFIPVYSAEAGGVVTELGTIAAVGAAFTGQYYVGLASGASAEAAFRVYLAQLAGVREQQRERQLGAEERRTAILGLVQKRGIALARPLDLTPHASFLAGNATYTKEGDFPAVQQLVTQFLDAWATRVDKILIWERAGQLNLGVLVNVNGIVELHFISIGIS